MDFDYSATEQPEAGADAVIESDGIDDTDMAVEMELLAARVQAARHCGA